MPGADSTTGAGGKGGWQERIDAYREIGWIYAAAINTDFGVYCCDDPAAPELNTDPVAYSWAWEKPLRRVWWKGWGLLLAPFAWLLLFLILGESPLESLLSMSVLTLFAFLILALLLVILAEGAAGDGCHRLRRVEHPERLPEFPTARERRLSIKTSHTL